MEPITSPYHHAPKFKEVVVPYWDTITSVASFALIPYSQLFLLFNKCKSGKSYKKIIPSAPGHTLVGSFPELLAMNRDIMNFIISYSEKYGAVDGICRLKIGFLSYIIISDPKKAGHILENSTWFIRGKSLDIWQKFSKGGMQDTQDTMDFRKIALRVIGEGVYKKYYSGFINVAMAWAEKLSTSEGGFSAINAAERVTLATMGESLFKGAIGSNPFGFEEENESICINFLHAYRTTFEKLLNRMISPLASMPLVGASMYEWQYPEDDRVIKESVETLISILEPIFDKAIKDYRANKAEAIKLFESFEVDPNKMDKYLMLKMSLGFLQAGFETGAKAWGWLMYQLGANQTVQDKLREVIREKFGGKLPNNPDDLLKVTYIRQVVEEILRLYPPFPVLLRDIIDPKHFQEFEVYEGETFLLSPLLTGYNEKIWENSTEFRPERWSEEMLTEKWQKIHPECLTFLGGPHQCPGRFFIKLELAVLICAMVPSFKIHLKDPAVVPEFLNNITLHSKEPILIRLEKIV